MEKSCSDYGSWIQRTTPAAGTCDPTLAGSGAPGEPSAERNNGDGTNGYGRPEAMEPKLSMMSMSMMSISPKVGGFRGHEVYELHFCSTESSGHSLRCSQQAEGLVHKDCSFAISQSSFQRLYIKLLSHTNRDDYSGIQ
jgi:hypothetical protein